MDVGSDGLPLSAAFVMCLSWIPDSSRLVVCTSEHGRTPRLDNSPGGGRDHWSRAYSSILAGGGVHRGCVVGASDRQAGEVTDRPISPKDLLATMYHLLGIDHKRLTFRFQGRDFRLTDIHGEVVKGVLA